jgi:aldehyde dehydrogenase (NAD+)
MHSAEEIIEIRKLQAGFFSSGCTKEIKYRKAVLRKLKDSILANETGIKDALKRDLNKPSFEAYATEIGIVLHELRIQLRHISSWARAKKVGTPLFAHPSSSMIVPEPFGLVLIISPWNYPFQLPLVPLIGAIAAGNVVTLRQSRYSPATNDIIRKILRESCEEGHVSVIECDLETAEAALKMKWDMIFFTGSTSVGRKVYEAAARNLTPVVLELGGKSPVIVEEDANVSIAAKKIVWGKMINSGQTCISPDYLFVHEKVSERLITAVKREIVKMYGERPLENKDYTRLISEKALDRLLKYLEGAKIIHGGGFDRERIILEPTLVEAGINDAVMQEEIFGPVLPVIVYSDLDEVIRFISSREKPLAAYLFSRNRKTQRKFIKEISSGACLINDVILHIANSKLPFGGVGESGIGRYHGKESFRAFSNLKAVMKTVSFLDVPIKYPPYGMKEKILRYFLR